jgi:hypothetical protein
LIIATGQKDIANFSGQESEGEEHEKLNKYKKDKSLGILCQ